MSPWKLVLVLASSGLGAFGFYRAVRSVGGPELAVDRILVEGNERLSDGEIRELIEVDETTNILTLDLDEVKRKLLRSAWVKDVELKRVFPRTLTLRISERTPVAIGILDRLYLLAEDGTILDELPPFYDTTKLVLTRGLRGGSGAISTERAALAGRLAQRLAADERLALTVSELDVAGGRGSISIRLRAPAVTLLVSEDTAIERLAEVVPLLSGITERYPSLAAADLRFRNRIYLKLNEPDPGEAIPSPGSVAGGASF
jgi:cell division septal protein FtsQ